MGFGPLPPLASAGAKVATGLGVVVAAPVFRLAMENYGCESQVKERITK